MLLFTLAFLLGDLYLQTFAKLPSLSILLIILVINVFLWWMTRFKIYFIFLGVLCGFTWTAWYAHTILSWSLPKQIEGKPILAKGYIRSLPITDQWQTHFIFSVDALFYDNHFHATKTLIKLSWRNSKQVLKVGDQWQLLVSLKQIHSSQNPGSFDYEAWAMQKGLRATGYVITKSSQNRLLGHHWALYPINQIRQYLALQIQTLLPHSKTSPWLLALTIGERAGIDHDDWRILRNTGTNHLMAIAGLHIGIIAGIFHFLLFWIWRRIPVLMNYMPATHAAACGSLCAALLYSAFAGFSIPTQRACLMLTALIIVHLSRRAVSKWHLWASAMLIILLANPLSVLTESFWLSFVTIALIIYGMHGRLAPHGFWWKWGRVQWVIGIGLIPLSLYLFHECSLISFIANSIAIPWLAFFILPFCFIATILIFLNSKLAEISLLVAAKSLAWLWTLLTWLADLPVSTWHQFIPTHYIMIFTTIAFLFFLLPSGLPGRMIGIVWLLPLFLYPYPKPGYGDYWITLLDVGQGLSVVIQTQSHILIYDTGPKYANHDSGEQVVVPYLETINAKKIDMLVISHPDNDHSGGARAILNAFPVLNIRASVPERMPTSSQVTLCLANEEWEWDDVHFTFLYPTRENLMLGNDSSCVLRIDNGHKSLLLTGDIERHAEKYLLTQNVNRLAAHILQAPHHGSKTSSLPSFINTIQPQIVLYSVGYRNRYHFPHQSVVKAYQHLISTQLNTATTGSILLKVEKSNPSLDLTLHRVEHQKYWHI